jgi:hypothetical protein
MNNENVQDTRYRTPKEDATQKAYEEVSRHTEIQGRHDNRHDNLASESGTSTLGRSIPSTSGWYWGDSRRKEP